MPRASSRFPLRRLWFVLPLLLIALLVALWDWNWFKPLVERQASTALGRSVLIDDLDVTLSWHPDVMLTGITLANPDGFPADAAPLAVIKRIAVRFGIRDLFDHRVRISRLDIDQPVATLATNAKGRRNWPLNLSPSDPDAKPWDVQIADLTIHEGRYSLIDKALKADISGTIVTAAPNKKGESMILAQAQGLYDGEPFKASFTGDSLLSLRTPQNPYLIDFNAESGSTRVALKGSLLDPLQFAGARLRLMLQGADLSALADFTKLPLPNTPPYKLEGELDYKARRILFNNFKGVMGESDLAGDVSVRLQKPRPLLEATVRSSRLRLQDLSGLIGGNPNAPDATAVGGDGRLLPATPINLPRLQAADVRLDFKGEHIVGDKLPFDRLAFKLAIDDGILKGSPVDFGIGEGTLRFYATLDPRGEQLGLDATAELRRVDVSRLMQKTGYQGSGRIGGFATLKGRGRSAAELLGNGDGQLKLAMAGGNFSANL